MFLFNFIDHGSSKEVTRFKDSPLQPIKIMLVKVLSQGFKHRIPSCQFQVAGRGDGIVSYTL